MRALPASITLSPKKSATPPTASTSAIAWSPARARFSPLADTRRARLHPLPSFSQQSPRQGSLPTAPSRACRKRNQLLDRASFPKSLSIFSPRQSPSALRTGSLLHLIHKMDYAPSASNAQEEIYHPPWTNSPSSAKSTRACTLHRPPCTSAPGITTPSAPRLPLLRQSKSWLDFPTLPAASDFFVAVSERPGRTRGPLQELQIFRLYPVCFAIRASIFGPISTPMNAKRIARSGCVRMTCEPLWI